jgi:hypothetical protein
MSNLEHVIELVDSGKPPIIRFIKDPTSCALEKGQYARVVKTDDLTADVTTFDLDFSEFWQYNQQIARSLYYNDKTGERDILWHQTNHYPIDYRESYYLDVSQSEEFEIVDECECNYLIHLAFIESVKRFAGTPNAVDNYQEWLEDNLISVLNEFDNLEALTDGSLPW